MPPVTFVPWREVGDGVVLTRGSSKFFSLIRRLATLTPDPPKVFTPAASSRVTRRVQRRLSDDQVLALVASYESGEAIHELAKTHGIHRHSVTAHLARADVKLRPKGLLPDQADEAARLYLVGWSLVKIAKQLGCDPETVRRALVLAGVELRKPWERP